MLAEWVLLGNLRETGLSLQASCERRDIKGKEDLVSNLIKKGVDPESIPRDWLLDYCFEDVRAAADLFAVQLVLLQERKQLHLQTQRSAVACALADIEFAGLTLDRELVNNEYNSVLAEYVETKKALENEHGQINWRSRKQVAELLYETLGFSIPRDRRGNPLTTAGGDRPTDKATISSLVPRNVKQRNFVESFKKVANLNAKLTKTLEFFKGVCDLYDSRFYGSFNQGTTATHRLSSSGRPVLLPQSELSAQEGLPGVSKARGIQLQNIPREYKRLIRARRSSWVLVDVDAAQLEFRVAADLGNDNVAKQEIKEGVDVHGITARTLTDAGEPTGRQDAKSRTFRPLFGGSSGTPAEQAYCKFFQQKYSSIYATQRGWCDEVLKTGKLRTAYGMEFYWPGTRMSRSGYIDNTTSIFNFAVQGFATGEIIPLILVSVWHRIRDLRAEIICTVHDSILLEVHPEDLDAVKAILADCFTNTIYTQLKKLYNYDFKTQLGCEIKVGQHWGSGVGEKYEARWDEKNKTFFTDSSVT
jgi:DNA polymerase-1